MGHRQQRLVRTHPTLTLAVSSSPLSPPLPLTRARLTLTLTLALTLARTLTLTLTLTQTLNPNPNPKPNQAALEGAPGPASRAVAAASKHAASQVSRPPARSNTDSSPTSGLAHASQSQLWAANNKSPDPHELTSQVSRPTSAVGGTSGEPEPG